MSNKNRFWTIAGIVFVALAGFGFRGHAQNQPTAQKEPPQKKQMMMQCPMMDALQSLRLPADAPPVLLAQEERLKLTADQKEQLQAIAETARRQARDVLNEQQSKQIEQALSGPLSPMQLARTLKKDPTNQEEDGDAKPMCPMCKKMMQQRMEGQRPSSSDLPE